MSSPGPGSSETKPEVSFEDLWRQLGQSHQTVLQELEAKVAKLKKERCLDAQRLEVFFNRNQQLKEQNKNLQDTISSLEERLRAGDCERCGILEDYLKNNQGHNVHLINKLKQDKKTLEDENRRLKAELEKLKKACSDRQRSSSPEPDDCIIPDSPVMPSSLPAANKLKKRKNIEKFKFVRYTERPLPTAHNSLFIEAEKDQDALQNPVKAEVLVPNTCELDASPIDVDLNSEDVVAETCRLDLPQRIKKEKIVNQQHTLEDFFRSKSHMNLAAAPSLSRSPDSTTDRSTSLLPRTKRFSTDSFMNMTKRKKEESQLEAKEEKQDTPKEVERKGSQTMRPKLEQSLLLNEKSFKAGGKSQSKQEETLTERPNLSSLSPVFKKPNATVKRLTQKDIIGKNRTPFKDNAQREFKVEPMWSIDPALAFEMYDSEQGTDEEKDEKHCPGESVDTDCTWVSHSLLQGRAENSQDRREVSGLGVKANDSLDMLFDTSACGDYKSYNTLHMDQDHPSDHEEEEEEEEDDENEAENSMNRRKPGQPTFAHIAVIRKKDERRKLKGTTCKECEIYYAHLPEEERKKKLSNCSRHRFLYIPPCTPENFWEVGFPSTQTCIERGYIKEDQNPQSRSRRRQPLNALFSPKSKKQEN